MTWEDQQHICAFGRFNTRLHEVNAELKAKSVRTVQCPRDSTNRKIRSQLTLPKLHSRRRLYTVAKHSSQTPKLKQKMVEDLEEASNELIIADDDSVRFSVGETFVTVDNDDAETMLQAQLDEVGAEVTALEKEKKEITSAMADLKEKLYKKFGNAINLEE